MADEEPCSSDASNGDAGDDGPSESADDVSVVAELPASLRGELKEPLGPIFTDAEPLLAAAEGPLVAVGDIVTYHFERAGTTPDVAVVDGLTKRKSVDAAVEEAVSDRADRVAVANPPGALSRDLLVALREAIESDEPTVIAVDGEEDLAALPAILAAPLGASVVYGQPDEGMVHVVVTGAVKAEMASLLERMDGDTERLRSLLGY